MLVEGNEQAPEVHNPRPIQVERRNGSSNRRAGADHQQCVGAPREVLRPAVLSRVVERHELAAHGVGRLGVVVFVVVAALAGKREVREGICSTLRTWSSVLDREALGGVAGWAQAILAAVTSAGCDPRPQLLAHPRFLSHVQAA